MTGRSRILARYIWPRLKAGLQWLSQSREVTNFTYDISRRSKEHMIHAVAVATGAAPETIRGYFRELEQDDALRRAIAERVATGPRPHVANRTMPYGRRLGWYAVARAIKPETVIETGVEKGLGAVVLCAALLRNAEEGFSGRYYGTDFNAAAGYLLTPPYTDVGQVLYGDSLASLEAFHGRIDLFINDSDHSPGYEAREYRAIRSKLSERAVILGDNCHATDELARFSEEEERLFICVKEEPLLHWFPGAGLGISFTARE